MEMNIGNKIGGLIGVAVLILLSLGTLSYIMIEKFISSTRMETHTYEVLELNELLLSDLKDAETGQRGYLLTGEEHYLEPYNKVLNTIFLKLDELMLKTSDNQTQQKRLVSFKALIDEKLSELKATILLRKNEGLEAALVLVKSDEGIEIMDNFRSFSNEFREHELDLLRERKIILNKNASATELVITFGSLLGIIGLSFIGFFLVRNLSLPLKHVTEAASRIALGDLSMKLKHTTRKDEIGQLTKSFQRMQESLKHLSSNAEKIAEGDLSVNFISMELQNNNSMLIKPFQKMTENLRKMAIDTMEAAELMISSTNEISAATSQLSAAAVETSTAINQTTVTVEEVKQTSSVAITKAKSVTETANDSVKISSDGNKSVEKTIAFMDNIQEQMQMVADNIIQLSEQSQSIGEIAASVNDLAEQSNLLAVNAAIEAAKAGEHGKGFAVVAREVKSLAEQSKYATAQVRTILNDVQKSISAAVMSTEQGSRAVDSGVAQSKETGKSIDTVLKSINETSQASLQILATTQQQLTGMDQVSEAMENIKESSIQSVASIRQTDVAVKKLNTMGLNLNKILAGYKV